VIQAAAELSEVLGTCHAPIMTMGRKRLGLIGLIGMLCGIASQGLNVHSHVCFDASLFDSADLCEDDDFLCFVDRKDAKKFGAEYEKLVLMFNEAETTEELYSKTAMRGAKKRLRKEIRKAYKKISKSQKKLGKVAAKSSRRGSSYECMDIDYCRIGTFDPIPDKDGFFSPQTCTRSGPGDDGYMCNRDLVPNPEPTSSVECELWFNEDE